MPRQYSSVLRKTGSTLEILDFGVVSLELTSDYHFLLHRATAFALVHVHISLIDEDHSIPMLCISKPFPKTSLHYSCVISYRMLQQSYETSDGQSYQAH